MPSVVIRDHQGKSIPFENALRHEGWSVRPIGQAADVLLIDLDVDRPDYRDILRMYRNARTAVVLYPHGANPMTLWDGITDPQAVDVCLVPGEGHRMVMEAYGYPNPIRVIGWTFCQIKPFEPSDGRRVLFAPIHPLGSGHLDDASKAANAAAYDALLRTGRDVTVRYIGTLEQNGLEWHERGAYVQADLDVALSEHFDATIAMIDDFDVIVTAPGTFLGLSVARGKPTVAFHQVEPVADQESPNDPVFRVQSFEKYREIMHYPHDLADPLAIETACQFEAQGWRERFVGKLIDPGELDTLLRGLVRSPV